MTRTRLALERVLCFVAALLACAGGSAQDRAADTADELAPLRHQLPHSREVDAQARQVAQLLDEQKPSEALDLLARLARSDGALVHELAGQAHARGVAHWAREQWLTVAGADARRDEPQAAAALESALARRDAEVLRQAALRWPLAAATPRAWLACGDLEAARGRWSAAREAWREAARVGAATGARSLVDAPPTPAPAIPSGLQTDLAVGWTHEIALGPYMRRRSGPDRFNLWPAADEERVLVSNGLELWCHAARDGRLLWNSGEARGWDEWPTSERWHEFFRGADAEFTWIQPALGAGVAIAALQVPWQDQQNDSFQQLTIMRPTPERRLFAFDLATGARLWSHEPVADWDGESGSFEQRMRVAGPPLVADGRVYAPFCRMSGRIEYHVACFELESGARLWSTWVVSGQGELNMFNRYTREYCAAPLVLSAGRLFAQTNLGVLAALDPDSGQALWSATYESISQRPIRPMGEQRRLTVWRNAAPVAVAGAVLCAPTDAAALYVLDAQDGRRLLAASASALAAPGAPGVLPSVLLDADESGVWLGGRLLGRWTRAGGWHGQGPLQPTWALAARPEDEGAPRACRHGDLLIVPGNAGPLWLAARAGTPIAAVPEGWDRRATGNVLLAGEQLFTLSGAQLSACLDWSSLLERALADLRSPRAAAAALELLTLREQRARSLAARGRVEQALGELVSAREDLRGAPAAGQGTAARERQAELALLEAQWLAGLGRVEPARARLAEARSAAVSSALKLELQLLDFALVPSTRHAERAAALDALAALPGELEMPEAALQRHLEQLFRGALDLSATQQPPLEQGLALATWCGLMRAAAARERGDAAAAQLALQQLLLDEQARPDLDALELWPLIARALRAQAARQQLALPALYEERAQRERVELGTAPTPAQLLEVCRRYPLSAAAGRARDQLCAQWQRGSDIASLAALARELRLDAALPDAAESAVLRALAAALRDAGNQELARALAALDGRPAPEPRSDEPLPEHEVAPPLLGHPLTEVLELERPTRLLGRWRALAPGEEDSGAAAVRDLVLLWRDGRIEAWDERSPGEPLWTAPLYSVTPPAAVVASAGRIACALDSTLVGLDLWSGGLAWSARLVDEEEVALCTVDGVVVASSIVAGIARLQGFEAHSGAELWRVTTAEQRAWRAPLAGEGRVVLLACSRPDVRLLDGRMLVIDALRGVARGDFQLGLPLDASNADAAWIAAGRLCLPRFFRTRPSDEVLLRGIDLDDGSLAFALRAEQGAELDALIEHRGARTLVTRMGRRAGAEPGGALLSFDAASGSAATLLRLRYGERVIGAWSGDTLHLDTPHVCICQDGARPELPFTFVELGRGVRWMQRLPLASDEPDWDGMPAPLVGARGVLLAWGRSSSVGGRRQLFVSQYDRESGALLEQLDWSQRAGSSRLLEWTAVGSTVLATLDEERFMSLESKK